MKEDCKKNMSFQEQFKYQRELRGWSQAKMAEELATTPNRISAWERGVSLPSAYFREKICALFEMNAQELGLLSIDKPEVLSNPTLEPEASALIVAEEQSSFPQQVDTKDQSPASLATILESSNTVDTSVDHQYDRTRHILPLSFIKKRRNIVFFILTIVLIAGLCISISGLFKQEQRNPYPPYGGQLVLNETMDSQSQDVNWQEGTNESQASCLFKNGAYVAFQPNAGLFHACIAQLTNYQNFAYEAEMRIHEGEFGGLIFRSEDGVDGHYYLFRVHLDGSYYFYRFADHSIEHATLLDSGSSATFKTGLNATNLIGVVAQDSTLTLYVNRKEISSISDGAYTHGQIGVLAGSLNQVGPAEVSFKNIKVWTW
jgi:transcriptional regulator with XRE-family HTH domain